jgi:toxin FitB
VRFLLDTNVVSAPIRPAPDANVVEWLRSVPSLDLCVSALTLGELAKGVALLTDGRRREEIQGWISHDLPRHFHGRVLPVDDAVALEWGRLSAAGRLAGRELPVVDGLLLATAATRGLTLVTRNVRDCGNRGVSVLDPWNPS